MKRKLKKSLQSLTPILKKINLITAPAKGGEVGRIDFKKGGKDGILGSQDFKT